MSLDSSSADGARASSSTHANEYVKYVSAFGSKKCGSKRTSSTPRCGTSGAKSSGKGIVSAFQPAGVGQVKTGLAWQPATAQRAKTTQSVRIRVKYSRLERTAGERNCA